MIGQCSLYGVAVVLLLTANALRPTYAAAGNWTAACGPSPCRCNMLAEWKTADCSSSGFTAVPKRVSHEVQVLNLTKNNLTRLDKDAFGSTGLINLKKLILHGCSIELVDKDAFRGLGALYHLDLSDNKIRVFHPGTFRHSPWLWIIVLSRNPVDTLQTGLFSNMQFLEYVGLNQCQISQIQPNAFQNISSFGTLYLSGNKLVNMSPEVFHSSRGPGSMYLKDNPWRCDCNLRPLIKWLRDEHPDSYDKYSVLCAEPQRLTNERWSYIDIDQLACQPVIQYPGQNAKFELKNDSLTIGCKVHGDPMPVVQWMYNDQVVSNQSHGSYNFTVNNTAIHANVMWTNLTVSNFRPMGESQFKCTVKNAAGWDDRSITVIVKNVTGNFKNTTTGVIGEEITGISNETVGETQAPKNASSVRFVCGDIIKRGAHNISKCVCENQKPKDEFSILNDEVAMKVRNLRTPYARSTVTLKIQTLLYEASLGQYDNASIHNNDHDFRTSRQPSIKP